MTPQGQGSNQSVRIGSQLQILLELSFYANVPTFVCFFTLADIAVRFVAEIRTILHAITSQIYIDACLP